MNTIFSIIISCLLIVTSHDQQLQSALDVSYYNYCEQINKTEAAGAYSMLNNILERHRGEIIKNIRRRYGRRLSDYSEFFLINAIDIETGKVIGKVWNSKISYYYSIDSKDHLKRIRIKSEEGWGYEHIDELIEQWDIYTINKINSKESTILGGQYFLAARVSKEANEFDVQVIHLYEFSATEINPKK